MYLNIQTQNLKYYNLYHNFSLTNCGTNKKSSRKYSECLSNLITMLWQSLITPWHCDEFCIGTQHTYFLQCVFPLSTIILPLLRAVFFILAVTNYSTLSGYNFGGPVGRRENKLPLQGNSCSFPVRETSIRELSALCEQNSVWLKLELLFYSSEGRRSWAIFY